MNALLKRFANYLSVAKMLTRGDVRIGSVVLYPVNRRLLRRNRLTLQNGIKLVAPIQEPLLSLFQEVWVQRHYLPPGYSIAQGDVIIDIGAHVGTFTVWAASANSSAHVIAVEPFAPILKYLRQNVEANHLANVTIVEACCGGFEGSVELYARGPAARNTIFKCDNYHSDFQVIARSKVITLDRLFSDLTIEQCDLLKLDCEGAEYDILYSARQETLDRIRRIAMEYHMGMNKHSPDKLAAQMERWGFAVDLQTPLDEESGYLLATHA